MSASDVWATHVMPCSSVDAIGSGDMKTGIYIVGGREGRWTFKFHQFIHTTP